MKIESIKDLEAVLKLCRKQGVEAIRIDGIDIKLGDVPTPPSKADAKDIIPTEGAYAGDDVLFWSAGN